jgi:peptidoglycan pentaglycine glycine transferase (the first glycine)
MISTDALQFSQLTDPAACLTEWDDFVAGVKNGHVFQTTRWAMYRQKAGWHPILLSLSSKDSLRAVCLVLHRSVAGLPVGGVLYVPRGPVLDYDSSEAPHLLSEVLDRLVQLARRRFAVVRISPDVKQTATWVRQMLLEKGFYQAKQPIQHTATIRLDLTQPLDRIVAGMKKGRRKDIRRFERDRTAWSFHSDDSLESLEILYRLYHQTIVRAGKSPKSFDEVRLMHESLAPYGSSFVFIVKYQDRPVAGIMVVAMNKHFWLFGAGTAKGDKAASGAGVVLHWEMIKWAKQHGYVEYDLLGMPDVTGPDDVMYGIYLFKRGWGGEYVRLIGEYDYAPYPLLGRILEWKLPH